MIFKCLMSALILSLAPCVLAAPIKIVTSLPDLAWMGQEIGGSRVEASSLLKGTENPHFVDALPEFTLKVAEADLVCIAGLDLEIGYMPPVLTRSGNAKVQKGGPGYCEIGQAIGVLEKHAGPIDRSMGDVHPSGNPHFYLSPLKMAEGAVEMGAALRRVDPKNAAEYLKGEQAFIAKMQALHQEITKLLEPLRSAQGDKALLIEYHKEFLYWLEAYQLKSFGSIEEKPGVPPSAGRLLEIAQAAQRGGVRVALAADYNPERTLKRFAELSGVELVRVPTLMQKSYPTYPDVQRHIAQSLLQALQKPLKGK